MSRDRSHQLVFSLRKLSVGLASVAIAATFFALGNTTTVNAADLQPNSVENTASETSTQETPAATQAQTEKVEASTKTQAEATPAVKANAQQEAAGKETKANNPVSPDPEAAAADKQTQEAPKQDDADKKTANPSAPIFESAQAKDKDGQLVPSEINISDSSAVSSQLAKLVKSSAKDSNSADELKDATFKLVDDQNKEITLAKAGTYTGNILVTLADGTQALVKGVSLKAISNENDKFALDPKNGLHEHKDTSVNGGYDEDYWGKLDISQWQTKKENDQLVLTDYTGDTTKVIIPNLDDFESTLSADDKSQIKQVTISYDTMKGLVSQANRIGISKTNGATVGAADQKWSDLLAKPVTNIVGYPNINLLDLHNFDTSNITNMSYMFGWAPNLRTVGDLSNWNTANVTNMYGMFHAATSLTGVGDLSKWDTSKVTNMSYMFSTTGNLTNIGDLSKWNTASVTNMACMFYAASKLTGVGDLSKWDTSKVTDMRYMFAAANKLTSVGDLSNWNTANVTNMNGMFYAASGLTSVGDLSNWNTAKVTNVQSMFLYASSLKNLNISTWNLANVAEGNFNAFAAGDTNLTVIANNVKMPSWYDGSDNCNAWGNHMAVVTNNPLLLKTTGYTDALEINGIDSKNLTRSIFYDSKGSNDAVQVISAANDALIRKYMQDNPGRTLRLASNVNKTDPISLANASFIAAKPTKITYHLIDDDDGGNVVAAQTVSGDAGTARNITLTLPANYQLADTPYSDDLPSEVKVTLNAGFDINDQVLQIHVKHQRQAQQGRVQITRTIILNVPAGHTLTQPKPETIDFTSPKNAIFLDKVTGKYLALSKSYDTLEDAVQAVAAAQDLKLGEYTVPTIAGYTARQDVVPEYKFHPGAKNFTVEITYTPNRQISRIVYIDSEGKVIKSDLVQGHTDETVKTNSSLPTGWQLADGQQVPTQITFRDAQDSDIYVTVEHVKTVVEHDHPANSGDKTSTGKVINGAHDTDLNQQVTRTITVTDPVTGKVTTTKQDAHLHRKATVDEVTGAVTYGDWQNDFWNLFAAPPIPGYHPNYSNIPAAEVHADDKDQTIHITYVADDQAAKIIYKDTDGKVIKTGAITGKTGDTVAVKPDLPAGYHLAEPAKVPGSYTFSSNNKPLEIVIARDVPVQPEDPAEPTNGGTDKPNNNKPQDTEKPAKPDQNKGQQQHTSLVITPARKPKTVLKLKASLAKAGKVNNAAGTAGKVKAGNVADSVNDVNNVANTADELPQTGDAQTSKAAALLSLGAILAALGIGENKKRKRR